MFLGIKSHFLLCSYYNDHFKAFALKPSPATFCILYSHTYFILRVIHVARLLDTHIHPLLCICRKLRSLRSLAFNCSSLIHIQNRISSSEQYLLFFALVEFSRWPVVIHSNFLNRISTICRVFRILFILVSRERGYHIYSIVSSKFYHYELISTYLGKFYFGASVCLICGP